MSGQNDESDVSVGRDPVFDWGTSRDGGGSEGSAAPSSRYDPKAMSRIVDITDLVDDDADSDDDDNVVSPSPPSLGSSARVASAVRGAGGGATSSVSDELRGRSYGPGGAGYARLCRQAVIVIALVGMIMGASMAIGYAVIGADPNSAPGSTRGGGGVKEDERGQQKLLETAERVVQACAESRLDRDMSECQKLCKKSMCCFEGGEYSCAEDERKDCAVYAGCEALVRGTPVDAAEEEDERD